MLIWRRLPKDIPDAIEAIQAECSAQPEITVGSLCDGENGALGKSISDFPGRVCVLADIERRAQRKRTHSRYQHTGQHCARDFAVNYMQNNVRRRS